MIRKLHRRIAGMTWVAMVLVLTVILLLGCYAARKTCERTVDIALEDVAVENRDSHTVEVGKTFFDQPLTVEKEDMRVFTDMPLHAITLDAQGRILSAECLTGDAPLGEAALAGILEEAEGAARGKWQDCQYLKKTHETGTTIVVAEQANTLWHRLRGQMFRVASVAVLPVWLFLALVSWLFAGLVVRPAKEALNKQRRFLADAGHELKTPLAAISVNAAALEAEYGENNYLHCIHYESERMSGLVRRMMEVACMEGSGEIIFQPVDLTMLLDQAVLSYESVAVEKRIRYELQIRDGVQLHSDSGRLRQLAAILLDNAFKYVDEGGRVMVSLHTEGGRAVVTVGNSGQGIPQKEQPYIFERFYRVDKGRTETGSYGLGLSIAGTLAQELKGKLSVTSEPGVWTEFRLTL